MRFFMYGAFGKDPMHGFGIPSHTLEVLLNLDTVHGDIQPGRDFPQDIGESQTISEAGKELTY